MTASSASVSQSADEPWTVRRILEWTRGHLARHGSESPRLEAEILLAYARGCRRIDLYTRFDDLVDDGPRATMRELVRRRAAAEPVAYLVGRREFFSLEFRVTPDVLIPRPETETLVLELIERARGIEAPQILDVGTGSGCIAIAAAVHLPGASITASDISDAALHVARENAATHGVAGRLQFVHGDVFGPLPPGAQFDFILSNPPYVAECEFDTLPPEIRLHEPRAALLAGVDGLDVIRRLIAGAPGRLVGGGRLLIEIAPEQSTSVREQLEAVHEFECVVEAKDLHGAVRVLTAGRRA